VKVPASEWQSRIKAAQAAGKAKGLDALVLMAPENIYYYSGFRTMLYTRFCCVVIPTGGGEPALIIPDVDQRAALEDWWSPTWFERENVRIYGPRQVVSDYMVFVKEFVTPGMSVGIDAMSFVTYKAIESSVKDLSVMSVYDELNSLKQIKSPSEIEALRKANEIALKGQMHIRDFLTAKKKAGIEVTEMDIGLELDQLAKAEGCDGFGYPTLVSFGQKMLAPHTPPLRRVIPKDEIVRVAFGPTYDGYSGDVIRTFVMGKPSAFVLKIKDAFLEAQTKCFEIVKPGATNQELVDACTEVYKRRGVLEFWRGGIGHGLGMTIHEPPRLQTGLSGTLKENMVVAIEPAIGGPDGSYPHCDVLLVTKTGNENLSPGMFDIVVI
jgi:Xaa-Pro aminopeptidase